MDPLNGRNMARLPKDYAKVVVGVLHIVKFSKLKKKNNKNIKTLCSGSCKHMIYSEAHLFSLWLDFSINLCT